MGTKICIKCNTEKNEDDFYWAKGSKKIKVVNKRMNTCKKCFCRIGADRTTKNLSARREIHSALIKDNPSKAKTCRTCNKEKPVADFSFHATMADLLNGECRECMGNRNKKRAAANKKRFESTDRNALKICKICKEGKKLFDFNKHLNNKDLHRNECRGCQKIASDKRYTERGDEYREKRREWTRNNPKTIHHHHLKTKFGISREDYELMFKEQGGKCAICKTTKTGRTKNFAVDHNHETGAVRSLLCTTCNTGIGHLKDDPALLRAAADYLERHNP